jgi:hypothetical protein
MLWHLSFYPRGVAGLVLVLGFSDARGWQSLYVQLHGTDTSASFWYLVVWIALAVFVSAINPRMFEQETAGRYLYSAGETAGRLL